MNLINDICLCGHPEDEHDDDGCQHSPKLCGLLGGCECSKFKTEE